MARFNHFSGINFVHDFSVTMVCVTRKSNVKGKRFALIMVPEPQSMVVTLYLLDSNIMAAGAYDRRACLPNGIQEYYRDTGKCKGGFLPSIN